MNILLIPPSVSAYDVLTAFSRQLFESMRELHENVFYYVPTSAEFFKNDLMQIQSRHDISHVISFNAVAFKLFSELELDQVKHLGWLVDYPAYHFSRLASNLSCASVLTANSNHQKYIEEMTNSCFSSSMKLGVTLRKVEKSQPSLAARDFDVAFVGGWMGEPVNFWQAIQNTTLKKIATNALELLLSDDKADTYSVVKAQLQEAGIDTTQNAELINNLIMHLNDFQRKYARLKLMNAVVQSGLKTLVVGNGWSDYFAGSHLYFHEPVPNESIGRIYENCKIAIGLNSNNGGCERALQAMATGSSVFSFGGIPIEELAVDHAGICITPSWQSEQRITNDLKQWHEQIMTDASLQTDAVQFAQAHSWLKVSERLLQTIQKFDMAETV